MVYDAVANASHQKSTGSPDRSSMLNAISPSVLHLRSDVEFSSGVSAGVHVYLDPSVSSFEMTALLISSAPHPHDSVEVVLAGLGVARRSDYTGASDILPLTSSDMTTTF